MEILKNFPDIGNSVIYTFGYPYNIIGVSTRVLYIDGNPSVTGHIMPRSGSITAIGIITDITSENGSDIEVLARINGDTTLLTETIVAPGIGFQHPFYNIFTRGIYIFSAGDVLQVRIDSPAGMTVDDPSVNLEITYNI